METPTYLENKNKHPRDEHIVFDEGPHIYTIDEDSDYMSVTTWNHSHFSHFDADKIIYKMMNGYKWGPSHKYWGMTKEQIKQLWADNGKNASEAGTKMHYDIECYYNDMDVEIYEDCIEWSYFEKFEEEFGKYMEPYRTEWMVWDKELRFAGSIDMTYENDDGSIEIYDWKRCKQISKNSYGKYSTTECIKHLPDSNFYHYSLQLNTYKALLEKNYVKKVKGMYLVCLHPNNANKSFQRIKVDNLQSEVEKLFELRMQMLKNKELKK